MIATSKLVISMYLFMMVCVNKINYKGSLLTKKNNSVEVLDKTNRPRVFAIIIGIADYEGSDSDLRYSDKDAVLFYNHLNASMPIEVSNGEIVLLLNDKATYSNIKTALSTVYKKSTDNDFIIFYFSGHGGVGSFAPYDSSQKLFHSELKSFFKQTDAKFRLVVADACFSGSIGTSSNQTSISNVQELYDSRLAVIMSSKPNQASIEMDRLKQGVFSYYLIKGMQGNADLNKDKYVTAKELFIYTKKEVSSHTSNKQIPVIYGINLDKIPLTKIR